MNYQLSQKSSPSLAVMFCVFCMPEAFCDWEAPPPSPPRREGEWSPRFPYRVDVGFVLSLISIYDSFNTLGYLYAEGVLWVRNCTQKNSVKSVSSVRERNILCERRNSPATFVVIISSRGCVLFLTENHRRTEHTAFHRDIKSTDNTERYS